MTKTKKQILIVFTGSMELGGIERSLLGLLDSFDYNRFDVDLFLYGHHGPLFSQINCKANLLPEVKELAYLRESFSTKIKNGCYYSAALRLRDEIRKSFSPVNNDETWAQVMRKTVRPFPKHYDLAVGFFRPFDLIIEKVNADRKVGWIHTDYRNSGDNLEVIRKDYSRLDTVVGVSEQCSESFKDIFPELSERVTVIENILSENFVRNQAEEQNVTSEMPPDDGTIKLLSIGRFSTPKNFDNVPDICRRIRSAGLNVTWYLIGFGSDEELIRQKIAEFGMEKHVIILGKKDNPYPYIKACDLYIQPSRYEGKCVAVREAQMLGKPVVITSYATSGSQLEDGIDGVIVPIDSEGCAKGIVRLLTDKNKMQRISETCMNRDYSNREEISKIVGMIES